MVWVTSLLEIITLRSRWLRRDLVLIFSRYCTILNNFFWRRMSIWAVSLWFRKTIAKERLWIKTASNIEYGCTSLAPRHFALMLPDLSNNVVSLIWIRVRFIVAKIGCYLIGCRDIHHWDGTVHLIATLLIMVWESLLLLLHSFWMILTIWLLKINALVVCMQVILSNWRTLWWLIFFMVAGIFLHVLIQ